MISIFIMYSPDRLEQLALTIKFLRQMELYEKCQKTLVVDQKTNTVPEDFGIIQVPRINNEFVWSDMWQAGVATARFNTVLYLDSDRLLPKNYLKLILDNISEGRFLFTSKHFMVVQEIEESDFEYIVNSPDVVYTDMKFQDRIRFDPRFKEPINAPGKNVMSGNTAFTRSTFLNLGGVDRWYRGHGAYADTDFHMVAGQAGCQFVDLGVTELHCHHIKSEKGNVLTKKELDLLGLNNFIYYCMKWKLPPSYAEKLADLCCVPKAHVADKFKEYAKLFD